MNDLDHMFGAYVECALWSSYETMGEDEQIPLDKYEGAVAPETLAEMLAECSEFMSFHWELAQTVGMSPERFGHDFWLTRNHHGAGFWDRGLGLVGTQLTDAAHAYGEYCLYIGDDGLIYGT